MKALLAFLLHFPVQLLGCCGWFVLALMLFVAFSPISFTTDSSVRNETDFELRVTPLARNESLELEQMPLSSPLVGAFWLFRPAFRRSRFPLEPGETLRFRWFSDDHHYESIVVETPDGRVLAREPEAVRGVIRDLESWEPASVEALVVAEEGPSRRRRVVTRALLVFIGLSMLSQFNVLVRDRPLRRGVGRDS